MRILISLLLILTSAAFSVHSVAQSPAKPGELGFSTSLTKDEIYSGNVLDNAEGFPFVAPAYQNRVFRNFVTLSILEEQSLQSTVPFTATVIATINGYTHANASPVSVDRAFVISYDPKGAIQYKAKHSFAFAGFARLEVYINDVQVEGQNPADFVKYLHLTNDLYLSFNNPIPASYFPSAKSLVFNATAKQATLNFQWPANPPVTKTHTQLEWTWTPAGATHLNYQLDAPNSLVLKTDSLFRNNATRVDLNATATNYAIPLLYDSGVLYTRVRAVAANGDETALYGAWSTVDSMRVRPHNDRLNWQATATYAEKGKRKLVTQYADGTLRTRQTATVDNESGQVIAGETMYDGEGRAAIQILPVPTDASALGYQANLNLFNGQLANQVPSDFFDYTDAGFANGATRGMKNTSGASKYYSGANPQAGAFPAVPNADGYPFTYTQYTNDNTGRVKAQSSLGPHLAMGSGQETKYYYGTPSQDEIDALLGTNAGYASHYATNMVKDANGQMSLTYLDMQGRTVATALAGLNPVNVDELQRTNSTIYPGQGQANNISENLIRPNSNLRLGNRLESVTTLLVPMSNVYTFNYALSPDNLSAEVCNNGGAKYFNAVYELEIAIVEDDGPYTKILRYTNATANSLDIDGGTPSSTWYTMAGVAVGAGGITDTARLKAGSYTVRKTLKIKESASDLLAEKFASQGVGVCAETAQDLSDCPAPPYEGPDPICASCNVSFETYKQKILDSLGIEIPPGVGNPTTNSSVSALAGLLSEIEKGYRELMKACAQLCKNDSTDLLDVAHAEAMMLHDLVPPYGQYARVEAANYTNAIHAAYNIFQGSPARYMGVTYTGTGNTSFTPDPASLTPLQFVDRFSMDWNESMFHLHPEYQKFQAAKTRFPVFDKWGNNFRDNTSFTASGNAFMTGGGDPTGSDPIYAPGNAAAILTAGERAAFQSKVIGNNPSDPVKYIQGQTIWQVAYMSVACPNSGCATPPPPAPAAGNAYFTLAPDQQAKMYSTFKNLYLLERQFVINRALDRLHPLSPVAASAFTTDEYSLHFPLTMQQAMQNTPGGNIPGTNNGQNTYDSATIAAEVENDKLETCEGQMEAWRARLATCPQLEQNPSVMDAILEEFKVICLNSIDASNPMGANNTSKYVNDGRLTFEAVVTHYFDQNGWASTADCHPFVVHSPRRYGYNTQLSNRITEQIQSCNCDSLTAHINNSGAADYATFNNWLETQFGEGMSESLYEQMMTNCNKGPFTLAEPEEIPYYLDCAPPPPCVTCQQLHVIADAFKKQYAKEGNEPLMYAPYADENNLDSTKRAANEIWAAALNVQSGNSLSWQQWLEAAYKHCPLTQLDPERENASIVACPSRQALNSNGGLTVPPDDPCAEALARAEALAQMRFQAKREAALAWFKEVYPNHCLRPDLNEQFSVSFPNATYHFTLYLYDQAGNLVQTVPPHGARPIFRRSWLDSVRAARRAGTELLPAHKLYTRYQYNAQNQVVAQRTPDAGETRFFYDFAGRLVASQNAKQAASSSANFGYVYSYTKYDALGRIAEVGELRNPWDTLSQEVAGNASQLSYWLQNTEGTEVDVTATLYDEPYEPLATSGLFEGQNLRNRVAASMFYDRMDQGVHSTATFYSYDAHGNVKELLHDYKKLSDLNVMKATEQHRYKRLRYRYDLLSGKVNELQYQPGMADAFTHRYYYDAENRLTDVYTNPDGQGVHWERQAHYRYQPHGPLARTELGQLRVQGLDYAYTLQGWLKGINSSVREPGRDIGYDGLDADKAAADAFAFGLHYYEGDYSAIGIPTPFGINPSHHPEFRGLYNGNIAARSQALQGVDEADATHEIDPENNYFGRGRTSLYRYDQLHRLLNVQHMNAPQGEEGTELSWGEQEPQKFERSWMERFSYDAGGNLLTTERTDGHGNRIDDLQFHYANPGQNNRLGYVSDGAGQSTPHDAPHQTTGNYSYDALGQLISNQAETITGVNYNVYGKIKMVLKYAPRMEYTYDAQGQRISYSDYQSRNSHTVYVRDATGQVIAEYERSRNGPSMLVLKSIPLYGAGRLGVYQPDKALPTAVQPSSTDDGITLIRGQQRYELSDHLGNVMAVITDKRMGVDKDQNGEAESWTADLTEAGDYYAFGGKVTDRQYNPQGEAYRYGFNGQQKSEGVHASSYTALYWEYDSRIGRRWNVDPIRSAEESVYVVNGDNPVNAKDPLGNFDSRREARQYRKEHNTGGRVRISQDGYYYIDNKAAKTIWYKRPDDGKVFESVVVTSSTKHPQQKYMNPYDIGVEWATGTGNKSRDFKNGDLSVELYKQHEHYRKALQSTQQVLSQYRKGQDLPEKSFPYELEGVEGVVKFINDYSTLATFGATGNLMFTYLGSHSLYMTVKSIDVEKRVARVEFVVHNTSTLESATRLPVLGYQDWYMNSIGKFMNWLPGRIGPFSETEQVFTMEEQIKF